ncbi:hypothetical protein [Pectobacterium fontis]|uniref:Uncharacterized protein n=1 Tax=Pectobacterium fontis TaxID=2558042 RepID=A0A7V8ILE1_9GAMM|nr:hypothetical protein [Pectobacterium fontis]KHN54717.1 hypothetical protein OI69_03445 [Pectobacterium fontis]
MSSKSETLREEATFSLADLYGEDISPEVANADMSAFERSMDDMLPALLASDADKFAISTETLRKRRAETLLLLEQIQMCRATLGSLPDDTALLGFKKPDWKIVPLPGVLDDTSLAWDNLHQQGYPVTMPLPEKVMAMLKAKGVGITDDAEKKYSDTLRKRRRHKTSSGASIKDK